MVATPARKRWARTDEQKKRRRLLNSGECRPLSREEALEKAREAKKEMRPEKERQENEENLAKKHNVISKVWGSAVCRRDRDRSWMS